MLTLLSSFNFKRIDYRSARNINVCKSLKDNVLIYFVFVDTKETAPWTDFDIRSTIDSVVVAMRWLERQAALHDIYLNLKMDYYVGEQFSTISKNLPMGSVAQSVNEPNTRKGLKELNLWADNIAKKAGVNFNISQKEGIPEIRNPKNKERLVAYLRDENQVESVALLFMVNNYFKTDISIPVNILDTEDVEFSIVSYKYPAEIVHNILHLFGASDLYKTVYRRTDTKIKALQQAFPTDIMQDVYALPLEKCTISPYTRYLIGWSDTLAPEYHPFLVDKFTVF